MMFCLFKGSIQRVLTQGGTKAAETLNAAMKCRLTKLSQNRPGERHIL